MKDGTFPMVDVLLLSFARYKQIQRIGADRMSPSMLASNWISKEVADRTVGTASSQALYRA